MKSKKLIIMIVGLSLLLTCIFPVGVSANENRNDHFKDIPQSYWAYSAINWMLDNKIVEGEGDGMFRPDRAVARDEFAKMMVLTLKLKFVNPETPTFMDVKKGGWQYKFVETAKPYLTVYKTADGDYYYHPGEPAMREDMAVALVKALGFSGETEDLSVLEVFKDSGDISPKLKKYVAIAVKHGIMNGYTDSKGDKLFAPQETLTRAQSAILLYNAFKANEEKIVFEEEKTSYDGPQDTIPADDSGEYAVPSVRAEVVDGTVVVRWNKITDSRFTGYKVVMSKENPEPAYPDDGYFQYITDRGRIYCSIQSGDCYNGGDFNGTVEAGIEYYFSITALYGDTKVAGNAIKLKMPEKD